MLNQRIGRNDPCGCGSGKKYKRCCLADDERRAGTQRQTALAAPPAGKLEYVDCPSVSPPDIGRIASLIRDLARQSPAKNRAELNHLLAQTQPVLDYLERQPQIEAASQSLEAHRADFHKLIEDEEAYLERIRVLFAEERFAPFRFTADDIRRAFDHVGQPSDMGSDDRFVEGVRAAILYLANQENRRQFALRLLTFIPDYLAANRPLDAWIIQHCAYLIVDAPNESNPFLFEMFSPGYKAWAAEQHRRINALLQGIGMDRDRLQKMSLDEIDAWIREQANQPAGQARMQAALQAFPEARAQAGVNLEEMDRESAALLNRPDAKVLLLPAEEMAPWQILLSERIESARDRLPDVRNPSPDPAAIKALGEVLWPVINEMAGNIFRPERIQQLIAQLRTYRHERFAAGDKHLAGSILAAIISLEQEDDPATNYFLNALCFASLRYTRP